ncbi:MAG TPA: hypothetical protein PLF40_10200 [Kofleriaceae bacterium]|nr:hypothetical protein [Kofleriaceae bacterium]
MKSQIAHVALVTAVVAAGCVADPGDSETSTSEAYVETVTSPPKPFLSCVDCSTTHEPGSELVILTSYHGECRDLWRYECLPQGYMLKIECPDAACEVNGQTLPVHAVWFEPAVTLHGTRVRFPHAGDFPIKLTVNGPYGSTVSSRTINIAAADRIEIGCASGSPSNRVPCDSPIMRSPVWLTFSIMAGTQVLHSSTTDVEIVANVPGQMNSLGQWQTNASGLLDLTVRKGDLVAQLRRTVTGLDGSYQPLQQAATR